MSKRQRPRSLALATVLALLTASPCHAQQSELKPGDIVGPQNWQLVKGMVGENLLLRIKQGYTFKIKQNRSIATPKEYNAATARYAGQVKLGATGELLDYVAGLPFPLLDPKDLQSGQKLAWNFYWRWIGDDVREGGGTKTGKIIRDAIEKDGSERRADIIHHFIKTRGRVTIGPKPTIPGYEHIDWMQMRVDEYPRDTSGTTTLEIRYVDPHREDDLYIYVPSIRRVRRAPPLQRCATLAPSEFNLDDVKSFNGKVTDFNYKFLGEKTVLGNFSQSKLPFDRKPGSYLPVAEDWEMVDAYVLEITPKDSNYCYPRKILYVDKSYLEAVWSMIWDAKGDYWKEMFAFRTPVTLQDGQEILSTGTVVIVNVQNGRSTLVTSTRSYNTGYQPTLFTLATLQTIMRGGSIR